MDQLGNVSLFLILAISSIVIWISGVQLSKVTDFIDDKYNLGDAFGGMIILSLVTNLPEIAIILSGALRHDLSLATGNILGGIAVQTVVLVILDFFCSKKSEPLLTLASSKSTILEAILVIIVLSITIVGSQLKTQISIFSVSLPEFLIFIFWIAGLLLINKLNIKRSKRKSAIKKSKEFKPVIAFILLLITASATLVCGVLLEQTSGTIAHRLNIDGVIFGATILAVITSLPEISTGIASVKLKDYQLATGDIFGGNSFLPVLFLVASLISGGSPISKCSSSDIYLTAIGILLTCIYLVGMVVKPTRRILGVGFDSLAVFIIYILSVIGLLFV